MVDNSSDTSHYLALFISKEILCLAKLESGIAIFAKCVHVVAEKIGRIIRIALV